MPTVNQLIRKSRKDKRRKSKAPALQITWNASTCAMSRCRTVRPSNEGCA
jgi:ribosomal protein S12